MLLLPPKVLKVDVLEISPHSNWNEGNESDMFYGFPYKWTYTLNVYSQMHGNPDTTSAFAYDGMSVKVGDWIAPTSVTGGIAVQITEIISQDSSNVVVVAEDLERYNLSAEAIDTTSYGSGGTGPGVIFELGDDGLPIIGPLEANYLPATVQGDLTSRFRFRNYDRTFVRIFQPGHPFNVGSVIRPVFSTPGTYELALADGKVGAVIGSVTSVNYPADGWFTYRPMGQVVNNINPPLVGNHGDFFYVDPTTPGVLTKNQPANNARPVYMRLEKETRGILLDTGSLDTNETKKFDVAPTDGQVEFTLPIDAEEVLYMSINGIENEEFTFDAVSKVLTFDPVATGYGVDSSDEVFFIYKS